MNTQLEKQINRKLSTAIALEASKRGVTVDVVSEDMLFIANKKKQITETLSKNKKHTTMKEVVVAKVATVKEVEKPIVNPLLTEKLKEEKKPYVPIPFETKKLEAPPLFEKKYTNISPRKLSNEDIDFIEQKCFKEHLGYRKVANMLNKDEKLIRKQVACMMEEMIA